MAIIVPNTASTLTAAGCVVGSVSKWVWFALAAPISSSGSATIYRTASAVSGSEMLPLVGLAGTTSDLYGPFNSPCGVYVTAPANGASVVVWMKQEN